MFHDSPRPATGNRLIDCLHQSDAMQLIRGAERIALNRGTILYRQDGLISHAYFPISGCCCYTVPLDGGRHIEATTIGKEGMLGLHLALGIPISPLSAVAVVSGEAIRVSAQQLRKTLNASPSLDTLMKRYVAYCLLSASRSIACTRIHVVEARVCRRLLLAHDRVGNSKISLTHELLGEMLGVRRQTVTSVAKALQMAQLIDYRHGVIQVLDRKGLEVACCDCYASDKAAYNSIVMN